MTRGWESEAGEAIRRGAARPTKSKNVKKVLASGRRSERRVGRSKTERTEVAERLRLFGKQREGEFLGGDL
jgi:hypothetical protein